MTPTPPGLLSVLRPLLDEALDLGPEERHAFLAHLQAEQPVLAAEVMALLAAEEVLDAERFLGGDARRGDRFGPGNSNRG
jgi:hypothetical protein